MSTVTALKDDFDETASMVKEEVLEGDKEHTNMGVIALLNTFKKILAFANTKGSEAKAIAKTHEPTITKRFQTLVNSAKGLNTLKKEEKQRKRMIQIITAIEDDVGQFVDALAEGVDDSDVPDDYQMMFDTNNLLTEQFVYNMENALKEPANIEENLMKAVGLIKNILSTYVSSSAMKALLPNQNKQFKELLAKLVKRANALTAALKKADDLSPGAKSAYTDYLGACTDVSTMIENWFNKKFGLEPYPPASYVVATKGTLLEQITGEKQQYTRSEFRKEQRQIYHPDKIQSFEDVFKYFNSEVDSATKDSVSVDHLYDMLACVGFHPTMEEMETLKKKFGKPSFSEEEFVALIKIADDVVDSEPDILSSLYEYDYYSDGRMMITTLEQILLGGGGNDTFKPDELQTLLDNCDLSPEKVKKRDTRIDYVFDFAGVLYSKKPFS
eukprot:NODE_162_length_2051_cov_87.347713_g138_i0.p1 GENE.NODE_162_length_2051_cov_87.347713_g138_i0~~NODE_162_length_2051_cov_87.347713_g138_i0.p1  ORF type:complete len:442 (+),score=111.85 NODE_162_length_2051_cov_87.347713_g138_i0:482-1807(+)